MKKNSLFFVLAALCLAITGCSSLTSDKAEQKKSDKPAETKKTAQPAADKQKQAPKKETVQAKFSVAKVMLKLNKVAKKINTKNFFIKIQPPF